MTKFDLNENPQARLWRVPITEKFASLVIASGQYLSLSVDERMKLRREIEFEELFKTLCHERKQ